MRGAWKVFAKDSKTIDTFEFKTVLPLMGENVPDDEVRQVTSLCSDTSPWQIEALFEMADEDGSGELEFREFVMLLKAMNPKVGDEKEIETDEVPRKGSLFDGFDLSKGFGL